MEQTAILSIISDECEIVNPRYKSAFINKFFQICEQIKLEILKNRNETKIIIFKNKHKGI